MNNEKKNVIPDSDSVKEFDEVYRKHSTLILNIAHQYLKDEHLAEEVMQEVLFRYYVHMNDKDIVYKKSWLITIAKNLCINILKKRKFELSSHEIELISDYNDIFSTEKLNAENIYLESERQKAIAEICDDIFDELKESNIKEYRAMHEVYRNERPQKEVAKEMGMTEGSFYTMLCRTKGKIRKKYAKRYAEVNKV